MKVYKVYADRQTGGWIGSPEFINEESSFEWNLKKDTDEIHYDTYEDNDETKAIIVEWLD